MMNTRINPDIDALLEREFPKDTVRIGESYLTLYKFHAVLKSLGYTYSKSTVYRWIKVPKEHLPKAVREILTPAPSVWYISSPLQSAQDRHAQIVPLRYLSSSAQAVAALYASSNTSQSDVLSGLHALKHQLGAMQSQLAQLIEEYAPDTNNRKDTSYVQH
jgi:predicted DNA-binding transcriptional regulator AlpA